jgi:polysaccharide deacetylase family protein (PEP-CTERM system associated)
MTGPQPQQSVVNVLSVDVEEYFHPTEIAGAGNRNRWSTLPSHVESQTDRVLELFAKHNIRATFFMLGWVAEKRPRLLRKVVDAGHEIGCHSYWHSLVYELSPFQFREDTSRAVRAIEDACAVTPRAYRAPSYSITAQSLWALDILVQLGFTHDSSIYPIRHDRYGIPGFGRHAQRYETPSGSILEVPIATAQLFTNSLVPVGGGGYMRILPYRYTAAGIRRINEMEKEPACIYFHPWELDPDQPKLASSMLSSLRTYMGLRTMVKKIDRLVSEFCFAPMNEVHTADSVSAERALAV